MARTARIVVMGYPLHIIQRGQLTGSVRFVEEIEQKIERRSSEGREGQENRINKSAPFILYSGQGERLTAMTRDMPLMSWISVNPP